MAFLSFSGNGNSDVKKLKQSPGGVMNMCYS